ncbi:Amino-acid acetyltransferase, mitochondrial [Trapelia coarctata]|nr:Amino-acid acetyltransferase, mitochondrial [Trapelia coarctata]
MKPQGAVLKEGRSLHKALQVEPRQYVSAGYRQHRLSTSAAARAAPATETAARASREDLPSVQRLNVRAREKHNDRNLVIDVLSSTSSKREAKSYLSRFDGQGSYTKQNGDAVRAQARQEINTRNNGVNLGSLFPTARAVDDSPVFAQDSTDKTFVDATTESLHIALVVIKSPNELDDETLRGIGLTLSQLAKLGLNCVVVVDQRDPQVTGSTANGSLAWRINALEQADRVVAGIDHHGGQGARRLDSIIGVSMLGVQPTSTAKVLGNLRVVHANILLTPLRRGLIPIVAPVGCTSEGQHIVPVEADDVVLALTREFAGISQTPSRGDGVSKARQMPQRTKKQYSLDRVIILDPHGGIPSTNRRSGSHIFINLDQEYEDVREELLLLKQAGFSVGPHNEMSGTTFSAPQVLQGEPFKSSKLGPGASSTQSSTGTSEISEISQNPIDTHIKSLELVRDTLALLPPSSSALLTTPFEAAASTHRSSSPTTPGVGTRPNRNPLIHNLLTDKPIFSSSLPATRLSPTTYPTTFVKRGMPLTILPDPRISSWTTPTPSSPPLRLSDPRIDLSRLIYLIEDSFSRRLDVQKYLARLEHSLAGIIIAGAYEGGAILTWETRPNLPASLVPGTPAHDARLVPYLDKFAVLKRSQGAGGVADIVFSAMVRDCFPQGVVWRSRRDNPVNRWYFERARGTWKIPVREGEQGWTMFWTTEGVGGERFADYEGVCAGVETSWGDGKGRFD